MRQAVPCFLLPFLLSPVLLPSQTYQSSYLVEHTDELHQLADGQVLLPPNVVGMQADKVIGVHDGVDGRVLKHRDHCVAIITHTGGHPDELHRHEQTS